MALDPDPYRILGLPRARRSTRSSAPIAGWPRPTTPTRRGRRRSRASSRSRPRTRRSSGARAKAAARARRPRAEPAWQADPERRAPPAERTAAGRDDRRPTGRSGRPAEDDGAPGAGTEGGAGTRLAGAGAPGKAGPTAPEAPRGDTRLHDVRRAEGGPFEPDWGGASWYGTTSGTYWTINPKEYAEPRKHGPEYRHGPAGRAEAGKEPTRASARGRPARREPGRRVRRRRPLRARRRAGARRRCDRPDGPAARRAAGPDPTPRHTTSSWWDATSGPASPRARAGRTRAAAGPRPRPRPDRAAAAGVRGCPRPRPEPPAGRRPVRRSGGR